MDSIDDNYIWQRRIHQGIRHQKGTVPFPESVEIGLEFNAALEREEKLDLSLLTNGVMLELCDFAKTVTKSGKYFLFEMLEFNFDLGMDANNEMQCYDYATRVHSKIKTLKEQIKLRPMRWKEAFALPEQTTARGSTESEVSGRYYPKRNKILDSSLLTDGSKKSQTTENQSNGAAKGTFLIKKPGGVRIKANAYPFCKELGVSLAVRPIGTPKHKLHPSLITNGVMIELLDFSRVLCGALTQMVNDLVKQNFGYELDRLQFRLQLAKLTEKKYTCLTGESRDSFRKEPFQLQTSERKTRTYKRRNINDLELERLTIATKRRGTLRHANSDAKEIWHENDQSYMCPVDFETDMQSSTQARPETKLEVALNVKQEEEEVFISPAPPRTNSHIARWFNYHQTQKSVSDLFSEDKNNNIDVKTPKQKLWLRRATRSKQILKSSRVNDIFASCREIGLDFNVGSGNKKNLDLQLLTNRVLWEVYKFATAMTKSLRSFLFDILNNNFNLTLQDELHERNFLHYIMTKEKNLLNNPARKNVEFLSCTFQFPEVYNMVDVTSDFKTEEKIKTEQETNWESSQETDVEPRPFCKRLGLNLWSTEERPASNKLDLTVLTTGAVLETFTLIRELCGTARELVNDVLEHNFDLELQSGSTEAAQVIQRWYAMQKSFFRKQNASARINQWLNEAVYNAEPLINTSPSRGGLNVDFQREAQQVKKIEDYRICKDIRLDLDIRSKSEPKTKLDLRVLTRRVVFELHQYVEENCKRYVPALYEILDYNFDLSSQNHRKVEFAWSIASQVIAMAGKHSRKESYLDKVFELPFEVSELSPMICKEEQEDGFNQLDPDDYDDVMFVRELKPVDIEVEIY
ncbi:uncharacterized protein LOC122995365 [Scomber scombrus]|uniref:Uncharacterized protein LOC122995365 n=1 Tax=Scomber scombrus TaxID=13677 RepID=A0AAV1Q9T5_SCOSC